jgi:hypothetical protein
MGKGHEKLVNDTLQNILVGDDERGHWLWEIAQTEGQKGLGEFDVSLRNEGLYPGPLHLTVGVEEEPGLLAPSVWVKQGEEWKPLGSVSILGVIISKLGEKLIEHSAVVDTQVEWKAEAVKVLKPFADIGALGQIALCDPEDVVCFDVSSAKHFTVGEAKAAKVLYTKLGGE